MKKTLLLGILMFTAVSFAAEVESTNTKQTKVLGVHPWKTAEQVSPQIANWSIGLSAGFSMLDGDFVQPGVTIIPTTKIRPTGEFYLNYDFTPVWGIRGVYTYANYGVKRKGEGEAITLIDHGHMHSLEALLTFDLVDACYPRRKTDIFSTYILFGGGLGFYNCDYHVPGTETIANPRGNGKYDMAGIVSVGLMFEFNVSRVIALNAKGMYHIYTKDNLDGRIQGNSNDLMEYVSAGVRFKLEGRSKSHVCNFASFDNLRELNQKDQQPQKDTLVVLQSDTIYVMDTVTNTLLQTLVQQGEYREDCRYVYFDNDKYSLSDISLRTIQQLAADLERNPEMCVELRGYCDYTGSEAYNATLGQKRADRVKQELKTVYGIADDRILAVGLGRLNNVSKAYAPNRRCEMRLVKRNRLEELKAYHKERLAQQVPAAPSAEIDLTKQIATVTVKKNVTTLSRLARKYYGNTHCWAYIYLANTDVIENPDRLEEGTRLLIPVLTAEQKKITANQVNTVLGR